MLILRFIGLFSSAYQGQPHSFQSKPGNKDQFYLVKFSADRLRKFSEPLCTLRVWPPVDRDRN